MKDKNSSVIKSMDSKDAGKIIYLKTRNANGSILSNLD